MSNKEKRDTHNLSFAEQLQSLMPNIKKIQENVALKKRVWEIYIAIGEFHLSHTDDVWPDEVRTAFTERLLSGDSEALKELEEMERHWLDK